MHTNKHKHTQKHTHISACVSLGEREDGAGLTRLGQRAICGFYCGPLCVCAWGLFISWLSGRCGLLETSANVSVSYQIQISGQARGRAARDMMPTDPGASAQLTPPWLHWSVYYAIYYLVNILFSLAKHRHEKIKCTP